MTPRENMLAVYRHEVPEYVPNFFKDLDIWDSYGERYFGAGTGKDWFGVSWTYVPEMHSQTETIGQEQLKSLEDWRRYVHLPELDSYNWQGIASEATKNWNRKRTGILLYAAQRAV